MLSLWDTNKDCIDNIFTIHLCHFSVFDIGYGLYRIRSTNLFGMAGSYNKKGASNRKMLLSKLQKNKRGFLWVTLGFFLISLAAHWVFAWFTYVQEQQAHSQPIQASDYFNMTVRDIMENWQSEFLQLMWQVAGLSFLLYVGSPQSKESSERIEEKIDLMMKKLQERDVEQKEKEQIAR